jgi:hypothetical protein
VGLVAAALWLSPAVASAEWYVSPWVGPTWGEEPVEKRTGFGFDLGGMFAGVIGAELDFGYAPDFFDEPVDNYAMTVMANLMVGIPFGGTEGPGVRPFATGGAGLMRTSSDLPGEPERSNDFGVNVGGGVMGFFNDHVGLRGDVRYFRNLTLDLFDRGLDPGLQFGDLDFWRASVGVVIR